MKKLRSFFTVPFLVVLFALAPSCKKSGDPSGAQGASVEPEAGEHPEMIGYPRLYQQYFDSGSEMESATPFDWPANNKVLQLFEDAFLKHLQLGKPDEETSFAIQRSESESLTIQFSPQAAEDSRKMVAVWVRREKGSDGGSQTQRLVSSPLSGQEQALRVLKSYAGGGEGFEDLLE